MAQIVKVIPLFNWTAATNTLTTYNLAISGYSALWDANAYGGNVAVYFEVVMKISATNKIAKAALFTAAGSQVTDSELTTSSTVPVRLRSGNIAANLVDDTDYVAKIAIAATAATVTLYAARLIIVQSGTITATETQIDIGNSAAGGGGTTYQDTYNAGRFYFDSSQYDGTVQIFFEAEISSDLGDTIYCQLFDTNNNAVSGSELSTTSLTPVKLRSGPITLVNGLTYKVRFKLSGGSGGVWAARVIIQQTNNPTKTESYYPIRVCQHTATATTHTDLVGNILWDNDEWDVVSKSIFHEVTLKVSSTAKQALADLNNPTDGDLDILSTSSTDKVLLRSAAITPTDNTEQTTHLRVAATTATATLSGSHLIVQAIITGVTTETQTVKAKAAIKNIDVTRTIQAKSSIQKIGVIKTIQAKANITLIETITQTVEAKARIQKTFTQTITAKGSILVYTQSTQTIQAKASIQPWKQLIKLNVDQGGAATYTSVSASYNLVKGNSYSGQSFIAPASNISRIGFVVRNMGETEDLKCEIYAADINDKPTGASLGSSTLSGSLHSSGDRVMRYFNFNPIISVTQGNKYCIVISCPDGSVGWRAYASGDGTLYPDGKGSYSEDGGDNWTTIDEDAWFRVYYGIHEAPQTYYVDENHLNASDSNAGTSEAAPLKTISKGLELVGAADTLIIKGGPYDDEDLDVLNPGNVENYVTISAGPINFTKIDPERTSSSNNHAIFFLLDLPYIHIDGFTTGNFYEHGIITAYYNSRGHKFTRLTIFDSQHVSGMGICIHDEKEGGCEDIDIYNCTIDACNCGIWTGSSTDSVDIKNCLLSNNDYGIYFSSLSTAVPDHVGFYNNVKDAQNCTPTNTQSDDPEYLDISVGDGYLGIGVDFIDAGIDVGLPYVGSAPDIGAWEWDGTAKRVYAKALIKKSISQTLTAKANIYGSKSRTIQTKANLFPKGGYLSDTRSLWLEIPHDSVVREPNGTLHVVVNGWNGSYWQIYHYTSTDNGLTWTEELLTSVSNHQYAPRIMLGSDLTLHVVWEGMGYGENPTKKNIKYIYKPVGGSWSAVEDITDSVNDQYVPEACIDENDNIHIVWYALGYGVNTTKYQVIYCKGTSGNWSTPTNLTDKTYHQYSPLVVVDTNGDAHVIWYGLGYSSTATSDVLYRRQLNGEWQTAEQLTNYLNNWQQTPCVVIDSQNNLHVAWSGYGWDTYTGYPNIQYIKRDFGTGIWGDRETVNDIDGAQIYPAIGVDADDNIYVIWQGQQYGDYNPGDGSTYDMIGRKRTAAGSWGDITELTDVDKDNKAPGFLGHSQKIVKGVKPNIPKAGNLFFWLSYAARTLSYMVRFGEVFNYDPNPVAQFLSAKASIFATQIQTITAKASIKVQKIQTIQAKANIVLGFETTTRTIEAKASIRKTRTETVTTKASIQKTFTQTLTAKGRIQSSITKNIQAKARIQALISQTINAKSRIEKQAIKSLTAKANIKTSQEKTIQAKATIQLVSVSQTITAKAKIVCLTKTELVSPEQFASEISPVYLVWIIPTCCKGRNIHAHVQVDKTDNTFGDLEKDLYSFRDSGFEYWDGAAWQTYPTTGVTSAYYGNQARVQVILTTGTKYWRVRGGVK